MKVQLNLAVNGPADVAPVSKAPAATKRAPAPAVNNEALAEIPVAGTSHPNVTFNRDPKGQIFYVVTDAQTGKEIRQIPPAAVRSIGEGIEEHIQQEEAKAGPHFDVKA
jgi:hypothetical protein